MADLEPLRRPGGSNVASCGFWRRPLASPARGRSALRGSLDPVDRAWSAPSSRVRVPMWHLRRSLPRDLQPAPTRVAASLRRRDGRAVGHGDRARTRVAWAIRVPLQAGPRVRAVRVVRAWAGEACRGPCIRPTAVRPLRRASRGDHGSGRATNARDRRHAECLAGAPPRRVRGRSPAVRLVRVAVPPAAHARTTPLRPIDTTRAGLTLDAPLPSHGLRCPARATLNA